MKILYFLILNCFLNLGCRTIPSPSQTKQETDDRFTPANLQLVDVTSIINDLINKEIDVARTEVNPKGLPWSDLLKKNLVDSVGLRLSKVRPGSGIGIHWAGINLEISTLTEIEATIAEHLSEARYEIHQTKFADSRYGDNPIGVGKALVMSHATLATANHSIAPVIRIGNHLIGVDKIGHFAEEGYWYFLATYAGLLTNHEERWQLGQFMEGDPDLDKTLFPKYKKIYGSYCHTCVTFGGFGYFGMASTGVCSYADMQANESGFQFFSSLWDNPSSFNFDIGAIEVALWNEEITPNKYKPGLLVRP